MCMHDFVRAEKHFVDYWIFVHFRLQLVETQGKQNKRCPVLLTETMVVALDCLMKHREMCGISSCNPFMFASITSEDHHIDPWTPMNKLAKEAGCEQPNLISSSRLRKYLATVCQILDLEDHELEWVSRHFAHNINTHKQHYCQHDATVEIAKVGSLMMAADEGQLRRYAGKKLSDIDVSGKWPFMISCILDHSYIKPPMTVKHI